jgi:hypothetical protein
VQLADPSAALGSEAAATAALQRAGYREVSVIADRVRLADGDFSYAWESNVRSAARGDVGRLGPADLERLQLRFEQALDDRRKNDRSFAVADVLYAYGTKPDGQRA